MFSETFDFEQDGLYRKTALTQIRKETYYSDGNPRCLAVLQLGHY